MVFPLEEKELLIAAHKSGEFRIISTAQIGKWVRVGDEDFQDNSDPAIAAKYLEALESLYNSGYVKQESDIFFRLTGSGFEIARELAEEK